MNNSKQFPIFLIVLFSIVHADDNSCSNISCPLLCSINSGKCDEQEKCFCESPNNIITRLKKKFTEVSYPGIGHFTIHDFYDPIHRPFSLLPFSPERINTRFILYTRKNFNISQVLKVGDHKSIKSSHFNIKNPTKFIVHGWVDNSIIVKWMNQMKNEFLKANDFNVVFVDWSGGNGPPYIQSLSNTRVVGAVFALFINDLKRDLGLNLSDVHIIGHSLGAQIAGYAGEKLKGLVGRISALDPAGPFFQHVKDPKVKLDPSDAQFVDAIHTDAVPYIPYMGFGMWETCGHLDFYPNGGKKQPGCHREKWTSFVTDSLYEGARRLLRCDHMRAIDFYLASMLNKQHRAVGYQCPDYDSFLREECVECGSGEKCAILGERAEENRKFKNSTMGTRFFLTTSDKYPYFI